MLMYTVWHRIFDCSTWLFFPGQSKQTNEDYSALKRDEVGEETGLLANIHYKTMYNQYREIHSAMAMCAISTSLLIEFLKTNAKDVAQVWFAGDSRFKILF